MTVPGNHEAVRMHISPLQYRILKPHSSAIRDDLRCSKPRMHSFEAMWSIYCCSFKRCAMVTNSSSPLSRGDPCRMHADGPRS
jgi:hypothetical protein